MNLKVIHVQLEGSDEFEIQLNPENKTFACRKRIGCAQVMKLFDSNVLEPLQAGKNPTLPEGTSHGALIVREIALRILNKWEPPYIETEICHCRMVSTHTVDQAILAGAHTTDQISRLTMASTSCGNCRVDVNKLIQYRLSGSVDK